MICNSNNRKRKRILFVSLLTLAIFVVAGLFLFPMLKMALHLDFSQEYRKVKGADKIRFLDNWSGRVYKRCIWGLIPAGRREESKLEEKSSISWLDTGVYDVTVSGDLVAWYDWEENTIFLGNAEGEIQKTFDVTYHVDKLTFSPDGEFLLFYEQEWGWSGSDITDDDYCYYWVIDLEKERMYTIYSGYREYFEVYWSEE